MNEPIVVCPSCKTEIKLTESFARPLIESTRRDYEIKIRQVQEEMGSREAELIKERSALAKEKATSKVTSRNG
jgi:hypothetical protein